jgi:pyruvate/2-oxoglutarate dehydrogenase complex dihydrolipoamide acyltransferase (E2) component
MILDKQYLEVYKTNKFTEYTYNYPSKDKKIEILLVVKNDDLQIKYGVSKWVRDLDDKIIEGKDTIFETTDLKAAWEKFEDYFEETEKEENPQQGQEPEVQVLMMSVEKSGKSFVFLQKQDGSQELIMELNINDADIVNNKPQFAKLDFSNDTSMQEPFNTEWLLAFVDDVQYEQASKGCSTYIIALNSIDQPGQNPPPEGPEPPQPPEGPEPPQPPEGPEPPQPPEGPEPPQPPEGPEPPQPPEGPESDKQNQGSASVNAQIVSEGVAKIAQETGLSSDDIQSALRSERIFDSFLTINKVDVNKLKSALGVSDLTKNQFIREMVKNA